MDLLLVNNFQVKVSIDTKCWCGCNMANTVESP